MTQKVSQSRSFVRKLTRDERNNLTIEHDLSLREIAQSGYRTNSIGGLDAIDTSTWTYAFAYLVVVGTMVIILKYLLGCLSRYAVASRLTRHPNFRGRIWLTRAMSPDPADAKTFRFPLITLQITRNLMYKTKCVSGFCWSDICFAHNCMCKCIV